MKNWFQRAARLVGAPFRYKITGLENIVPDRPKIFISNHAGSLGPIAIYISLPVHLRPWVIAEMIDIPRTADYLFEDFIRPAWRLDGKFGRLVSSWLAPIAVGVIRSFNPIAVDRNRGWCREAFLESNALLLAGENLLIFPENPDRDGNRPGAIRPFLGGFCWLSHMYYRTAGQSLVIQPMAINPLRRKIVMGKSITIEISQDRRASIVTATQHLEGVVRELYESIQGN